MSEASKTCSRCREPKPLSEFHRSKSGSAGVSSLCKACAIEVSREWYSANKERVAKSNRARYERNKDQMLKRAKDWASRNPDKIRAAKAGWKKRNPEVVKAYRCRPEVYRRASAKQCAALSDSYVRGKLHLRRHAAPPDLIEAKREQLIYHRLTKQLEKAINERSKA